MKLILLMNKRKKNRIIVNMIVNKKKMDYFNKMG